MEKTEISWMDLSRALSKALSARGLQTELAIYLEVHASSVTKWINGENTPSPENIAGIARFFREIKQYDAKSPYCSEAFWTIQANPQVFKVLRSEPTAWLNWGQWSGTSGDMPVSPVVAKKRVDNLLDDSLIQKVEARDPEVAETLRNLREAIFKVSQKVVDKVLLEGEHQQLQSEREYAHAHDPEMYAI